MSKILQFKEALAEIKKLAGQSIKSIVIVIAGPTCAGKSYMANKLQDKLGLGMSSLLSLDSYFKDKNDNTLPKLSGQAIYDEPGSYKQRNFRLAVQQLLLGSAVWVPLYDLERNECTDHAIELKTAQVIIAEGLYAIDFLKSSKNLIKIYIDIDKELALKRRIRRDTKLYQVSPEIVKHHFELRVWPKVEQYILPQKQIADLIINNIT